MREENETTWPPYLVGLVVVLVVVIGGIALFIIEKKEQMAKVAEQEAMIAELRARPLLADATFELQFGTRNPHFPGLTIIRICADGTVDFDNRVSSLQWQRLTFHLDDQSMKDLIDLINALNIMNIEDDSDSSDADGIEWRLLIKGGGKVKFITCTNRFPEPIEQLAHHMGKRVGEAMQKGVKAVPIEGQDHRNRENELLSYAKK
jgi:hypothetical protein